MLCKSGKGEKQYTENMHMPDYCILPKVTDMSFRPKGEILFNDYKDFSVTSFLRNDTVNIEIKHYHDFDIVEQFLNAGAAVKYPVPSAIFSQQERQDATHQLIY
jgi:hypothetical protein